MKLIITLFFAGIILGCGNSKEVSSKAEEKTEESETAPQVNAKRAILSQNIGKFRNTESYNIISVELKGNILQLDVTYNGGCKEHEFELVGSSFIMKSSPPKRGIQLYHHKNEDDCRELVNDRLLFDITDFAYSDKEIILNLEHYKEAIRYTKVSE